jgi:hypothetical protein
VFYLGARQSLLGEFRRDMGRFLRGENDVCPTIPTGYFGRASEALVTDYRRRALSDRSAECFASSPADQLASGLRNAWHPAAKRIYRNWLLYMASRRAGRSKPLAITQSRRTRPGQAAA